MQRHEIRLAQLVTVNHHKYPGDWIVEKINPKTIKLRQGDQLLTADPSFLTLVVDVPTTPAGMVEYVPVPEVPLFIKGNVVTAKTARLQAAGMVGYHVVTGTAGGKVQAVPLGGSTNGRYWSVTPQSLKKVDVDDLLGLSV